MTPLPLFAVFSQWVGTGISFTTLALVAVFSCEMNSDRFFNLAMPLPLLLPLPPLLLVPGRL
jgi:hypothetical protein